MDVNTETYIPDLIKHLDRIASANNDKFKYRIEIALTRHGLITYTFIAEETNDGHCFISDTGDTPAYSAHYASKHLKEACEGWAYKFVL